jgi:hypothetical protein
MKRCILVIPTIDYLSPTSCQVIRIAAAIIACCPPPFDMPPCLAKIMGNVAHPTIAMDVDTDPLFDFEGA